MITIITMTINCFHFDDNIINENNQLFNKILIIENDFLQKLDKS